MVTFVLGSVFFGLGLLFMFDLVNSRRDAQFDALAQKYNLSFEKAKIPVRFQSKVHYPIRQITGSFSGKEIKIEDVIMSYFSGPFLFEGELLPLPPFGLGGIFIHTDTVVDGVYQEVYPFTANFLAPRTTLESFLADIERQAIHTPQKNP
jgi:hypothetical protein